MKVLITGGGGFVGQHLYSSLTADGHKVVTFDNKNGGDIRSYDHVRTLIGAVEPDRIFHLAAISWPGESIRDPRLTMDTNIGGAFNVLEACRCLGADSRILLAGTSEEYGYHDGGIALTEDSCTEPTNPYGISKLAATLLGQVYASRYGMNVICTRAWNHTGPGRQAVNAESAFARRIVAVERGEAPHVTHGDLSSIRNFTDVRDVVRAYQMVIECTPGIYNVCHPTQTVTIKDVLDILVETAGSGVALKPDPALMHRSQEGWTNPSCDRLRAATGWQPEIPLSMTLDDLLQYWRTR